MSEQGTKPAVNLEDVIGKYVDLRDGIARIEKEAEERIAPMKAAMKTIESYLMKVANETGQTQFGTARGTAFLTTKTGCNIADKDAFWNWLKAQPEGGRSLLTLSANKTAVAEYISKGDGAPPPGINWVVMKDIQIRRS